MVILHIVQPGRAIASKWTRKWGNARLLLDILVGTHSTPRSMRSAFGVAGAARPSITYTVVAPRLAHRANLRLMSQLRSAPHDLILGWATHIVCAASKAASQYTVIEGNTPRPKTSALEVIKRAKVDFLSFADQLFALPTLERHDLSRHGPLERRQAPMSAFSGGVFGYRQAQPFRPKYEHRRYSAFLYGPQPVGSLAIRLKVAKKSFNHPLYPKSR